jgi:hypothetical protein
VGRVGGGRRRAGVDGRRVSRGRCSHRLVSPSARPSRGDATASGRRSPKNETRRHGSSRRKASTVARVLSTFLTVRQGVSSVTLRSHVRPSPRPPRPPRSEGMFGEICPTTRHALRARLASGGTEFRQSALSGEDIDEQPSPHQ